MLNPGGKAIESMMKLDPWNGYCLLLKYCILPWIDSSGKAQKFTFFFKGLIRKKRLTQKSNHEFAYRHIQTEAPS